MLRGCLANGGGGMPGGGGAMVQEAARSPGQTRTATDATTDLLWRRSPQRDPRRGNTTFMVQDGDPAAAPPPAVSSTSDLIPLLARSRLRSRRYLAIGGGLSLMAVVLFVLPSLGRPAQSALLVSTPDGTRASLRSAAAARLKNRDNVYGSCVTKPDVGKLKWAVDVDTTRHICCKNTVYAEYFGYWRSTRFLQETQGMETITFYDTASGRPLFRAPKGRTMDEFVRESTSHGWPSFRDEEVVWENVLGARSPSERTNELPSPPLVNTLSLSNSQSHFDPMRAYEYLY